MHQHQKFQIGVKGIIIRGGRALVLKPAGEEHWEVPGGRIDTNEDTQATLLRELHEELPQVQNIRVGRLVDAQKGQFMLPDEFALMLLFFVVDAELPDVLQVSHEHDDAQWIVPSALTALKMHEADRRAVTKAFEAQKYPC